MVVLEPRTAMCTGDGRWSYWSRGQPYVDDGFTGTMDERVMGDAHGRGRGRDNESVHKRNDEHRL